MRLKRRTRLLLCPPLFAAGVAAAWLVPAGRPAGSDEVSAAAVPSRNGSAAAAASTAGIPSGLGIPEPSGLPGDILHLTAIRDVRALRAAWPDADQEVRSMLLERWLELDPEDGIRFLLVEPVNGAPRDESQAEELIFRWLRHKPVATLKFLAGLPADVPLERIWGGEFKGFWNGAFETLSVEDAMALFEGGGVRFKNAVAEAVFEKLAEEDPASAVAQLRRLPPAARIGAWEGVANAPDPGVVIRLLTDTGVPDCPEGVWRRLFCTWHGMNAETAKAKAAGLPAGRWRDIACTEVVVAMLRLGTDRGEVGDWIENHAPSNANRSLIFNEGGNDMDPDRALELALRHRLDLPMAVSTHLQSLAEKDWTAALSTVTDPVNAPLRQQMVDAVSRTFNFNGDQAPAELEKVSSLLAAFPASSQNGIPGLPASCFGSVEDSQLPELKRWYEEQPPAAQQALRQAFFVRMEAVDKAAALNWWMQGPPSETRTGLLLRNIGQWANEDPQAAAACAFGLPESTDRDYAILNTAAAWRTSDPAAAGRWVESLPDSPAKTLAARELGLSAPAVGR